MSEIPIISQNPENQANGHSLENQAPWKKWLGLGVLTLGLAIVVIDTTLLNVSLSAIIQDLKTDLKSLQWVITAYALVLAAFTITGGRLGDLFGRKKMFMLGAIIFAIGSFIASISHNVPILLLGEAIIEGFGAALMMPATSSLVVANFSGKDRATAFGIWGGVAGASSAIGPLLGGYLTSHYSWRWGFRINVFIAVIVVLGSLWLIKESKNKNRPSLDWWGVVLSSLGLLSIVFGIIESTTYGWWKAKSVFSLAGHALSFGGLSVVPVTVVLGFIFLIAFIFWEKRTEKNGKTPLVSISIFNNRQFTAGVTTISILSLGMTGLIFALPVFLQAVKHLSSFDTGLALLPLSLAILIFSPVVGALSRKIEPRYFIQTGLLINAIAAFILRSATSPDVTVKALIPGLTIYGLGMAMVFAPITNLILSAVPLEQSGEASGVNNTLRQVGSSLGAAIIGAAVLTSLTAHLITGVKASQIIPDNLKSQITAVVSDPDSNIEFGGGNGLPAGTPAIISQEMSVLTTQAASKATQDAYVYSALFAFIGFIVALFLPKMHQAGDKETAIAPVFYAAAGACIVAAIIATVLILEQSSKTVIAGNQQNQNLSAQDIRNIFTPPNQQNSDKGQVLGNQTTVPADDNQQKISPRGVPITQATNPQPPAVQTHVNKEPGLAFQITLTGSWQEQHPDVNSAVFINDKSQSITIEAYPDSDSLSMVQAQLESSPSVRQVSQANFKNLPALTFTTTAGQKGIAILNNGRLYYLFGADLISSENFSFM